MRQILAFTLLLLALGCQKQYDLPPNPGRMIKDFRLESGQYGSAVIYQQDDRFKILVRVVPGTDMNKIVPIFTLSDGARCDLPTGQAISVPESGKITFKVTAASGDLREWEVEFRLYQTGISDYGTYSLSTDDGSAVLQVQGDLSFNEKYLAGAQVGVAAAEAASGENLKKWQQWDLISYALPGSGTYYLIRNLHSGMLLTGMAEGEQLTQSWEQTTEIDRQLWKVEESLQAGKFEISNKANGLLLTVDPEGSVLAQRRQGSGDQRWAATRLPKDSYRDAQVTAFFNRNKGSVAFDQGTSIPLSDGRVLWITQDAWYEGSLAPSGNLYGNHFISYSNSIIIQPSISSWSPDAPMMTADGRKHGIGDIVPKRPGKDWSWPGPGCRSEKRYIYMLGRAML